MGKSLEDGDLVWMGPKTAKVICICGSGDMMRSLP